MGIGSFFKKLPTSLLEASQIDGATFVQTFFKIMVPIATPAFISTGLLSFIAVWNEYLFALTFSTVQQSARTVPVAIAMFTGQFARQEPFGELMAAVTIVTLPMIILVFIFQRLIIQGLTAGAIKE